MSTMTTTSTLPDIAIDKHSSSYDVWNIPAKESNYATVNKLADFTNLFTKRSPAAETDNYVGGLMGFPSLQHISSPRLTSTSRQGPVSLLSLNGTGLSTYQDQVSMLLNPCFFSSSLTHFENKLERFHLASLLAESHICK